ncbi:MAG: AAA family ATPase [Puniceicoccales bacterium]|nr:AAA family ATPase [Puniceicoccales bacterium]
MKYFSLDRAPFCLPPNPDFLYLSPQHGACLTHLRYGIEQQKGIIVITGEVGCGKTLLLQTFLQELEDSKYQKIVLKNPCIGAIDLYAEILRNLALAVKSRSPLEMLECIRKALSRLSEEQREIVLVIDEAQNLSVEMLEQIRLLSNIESSNHQSIQIVIAGQPELRHLLRTHGLRQLRQRVAVYYNLYPLRYLEMIKYIQYRLAAAGHTGGLKFTMPALVSIYRASKGIPRLINALCDRALISTYVRGSHTVSYRDARRAIRDLRRL